MPSAARHGRHARGTRIVQADCELTLRKRNASGEFGVLIAFCNYVQLSGRRIEAGCMLSLLNRSSISGVMKKSLIGISGSRTLSKASDFVARDSCWG